MIIAEIYDGQGLGNQLWTYAVTRAVADATNSSFAILSPHRFKLSTKIKLDWGKSPLHSRREKPTTRRRTGRFEVIHESVLRHPVDGMDLTEFDATLLTRNGNLRLEGNFQSEKYLLKIKPQLINDLSIKNTNETHPNTCIINLRGGEYKHYPQLFLDKTYFYRAMDRIKQERPDVTFEIVTDDIPLAEEYFPNLEIRSKALTTNYSIQDKISDDFASLQNASYLILSNSSFSWWGAWTNTTSNFVIAPKYWARHNLGDGFWSTGDALTNGWEWLDNEGRFFSSSQCHEEFSQYKYSIKYSDIFAL